MDLLNFNDEIKQVVQIAQALAKENSNENFSPAHLLKAIMHKDVSIREFLKSLKKDIYFIEEWAEVRIESYPKASKVIEPIKADKEALAVFNEADNIRLKIADETVDANCLLISLCTPGVGFTYDQLKSLPLTPGELLDALLDRTSLIRSVTVASGENGSSPVKLTSLLKYTNDKINLARSGKLEKVVGREVEIRMFAEVLSRRTNSNIMIIGDPGVGKTAVINGFCRLVADRKASSWLNELMIFELSMGNLLAGASYKGEVEDRIQSVINEIKSFGRTVLIIEDFHELLDKYGSAPGAANIIKQELGKGEFALIATTTIDNFTKTVEKDQSLRRYFEIVKIEEANNDEVLEILKCVIPEYYQTHHGFMVSDDVLKETIRLTRRYLKERSLPSAAIDLIDRTMAVVRSARDFTGPILSEVEEEFRKLEGRETDPEITVKVKSLLNMLVKKINPVVHAHLEEEIQPDKYDQPGEMLEYLRSSLDSLAKVTLQEKNSIESNDIAAVVAQKTNIPAGKLQSGEREKLLHAEQYLTHRVIGQDHAIRTINEAILESRSGLSKAGQPIGSFFFLGPTGTGKTELAKTLAEFLFNDETSMIRFDMSEFKEEHSAALLYGAPPGYVGYEEGGLLVNKIRQRPYAVVLFDEIEKAHTSVFDIFLQILDEGKLHDRLGKEGDFSNAVVIFTSNIGSKYIVEAFEKNEIPPSNDLMEIMSKHFRPEFLGRLTEIIPFAPINKNIAVKILEIHLKNLYKALEIKRIRLIIEDEAKEKLALLGFNPQYGARPLIGIIRNQLRRPLSKMIIAGDLHEDSEIRLLLKDDQLIWKKS